MDEKVSKDNRLSSNDPLVHEVEFETEKQKTTQTCFDSRVWLQRWGVMSQGFERKKSFS